MLSLLKSLQILPNYNYSCERPGLLPTPNTHTHTQASRAHTITHNIYSLLYVEHAFCLSHSKDSFLPFIILIRVLVMSYLLYYIMIS